MPGVHVAHFCPTALCAPQCVDGWSAPTNQIAGTEATRGPRRLKGLVVGTQGDGEHPAGTPLRRTLGKKI